MIGMTHDENVLNKVRRHTRHQAAEPDPFDPLQPRLGRRESEPHSFEVSYLYDVLRTNFPVHHTLWDLHHYFQLGTEEVDIQFDISFFMNFAIPYTLSSYHAAEYSNRIPDLAINILSKSTWRADLSDNLEYCRLLQIPRYIVFFPYIIAPRAYTPPFLRVYCLDEPSGTKFVDVRDLCIDPSGDLIRAHVITLGSRFPFCLGLTKLSMKHDKGQDLYRLVLVDPEKPYIFPTKVELETARAEKYLKLLKEHNIDPQE